MLFPSLQLVNFLIHLTKLSMDSAYTCVSLDSILSRNCLIDYGIDLQVTFPECLIRNWCQKITGKIASSITPTNTKTHRES